MYAFLRNLKPATHGIFVLGLLLAAGSLQAQLVIGSDVNDGSLKVRGTNSSDEVLLEVDPNDNTVKVGSVDANENRDVEFVVFDPTASSSLPEGERYALRVDASNANIHLGSGGTMGSGSDGDVLMSDSDGLQTIQLDGASAVLTLGADFGQDGDIFVRDNAGLDSFVVDGATGDVTNKLSGEGLVKAWCRVDSAGNFVAGFRCTDNASYPSRTNIGAFVVDFTALGTDLSGRATVVSCSTGDSLSPDCFQIQSRREPVASFSSFQVTTRDKDGNFVDSDFTILVF